MFNPLANGKNIVEKNLVSTLYSGRFLTFQERDGWEFIERRHRVAVLVAWTPARELLLVEQ